MNCGKIEGIGFTSTRKRKARQMIVYKKSRPMCGEYNDGWYLFGIIPLYLRKYE